MAKTPRMYRVELFIEVPASIDNPKNWNWDSILNEHADTDTPVTFVLAQEVQEGRA